MPESGRRRAKLLGPARQARRSVVGEILVRIRRRPDVGGTFRASCETGQREVSLLMFQLRALGLEPGPPRRWTSAAASGASPQPLADHFDLVVGTDISRLELAMRSIDGRSGSLRNQQRRQDRMLSTGEFTFTYSNVVLQHVSTACPPRRTEPVFAWRVPFRARCRRGPLFRSPRRSPTPARHRGPPPSSGPCGLGTTGRPRPGRRC